MQDFLVRNDAVPADLQRTRPNIGRGRRWGGTGQPGRVDCIVDAEVHGVIIGFMGAAKSAALAARHKAEGFGDRRDE